MTAAMLKEIEYLDDESGKDCDGYKKPGWYFWDEVWFGVIGPYKTQEEAEAALLEYCKKLGVNE